MHTIVAPAVAALFAASLGAAAPQEKPPKGEPPRRGESVVAEGCLQGTTLQTAELAGVDSTRLLATRMTYQLKGKKDLLKQLRDDHEGELVKVTGTLESELPGRETRGVRIGNTAISIGLHAPPHQRATPEGATALPIVKITGFEGLGTSCR